MTTFSLLPQGNRANEPGLFQCCFEFWSETMTCPDFAPGGGDGCTLLIFFTGQRWPLWVFRHHWCLCAVTRFISTPMLGLAPDQLSGLHRELVVAGNERCEGLRSYPILMPDLFPWNLSRILKILSLAVGDNSCKRRTWGEHKPSEDATKNSKNAYAYHFHPTCRCNQSKFQRKIGFPISCTCHILGQTYSY